MWWKSCSKGTMAERRVIKVGSRKSPLALVQTHFVINSLKKTFTDVDFEVVTMTTKGDEILDIALSKIGEKNLFTRELEQSLADGVVDFVVHSLKDLPTQLPDGLVIGAVCRRDDPKDAVVMRKDLHVTSMKKLPDKSIVGTSSLRRGAQLARLYPNLIIKDVRGNLQTRFRKLDEEARYDCLVLAAAGLERMEWTDRISELLDPSECMYAVAQGAMAVECRHTDLETLDMLSKLHDRETALRCIAERALLRKLEGGCSVPVAVHTEITPSRLMLKAGVFSIGGAQAVIDSMDTGLTNEPGKLGSGLLSTHAGVVGTASLGADSIAAETLGIELAKKLLDNGAKQILEVTKAEMAAEVRATQARREAEKEQESQS